MSCSRGAVQVHTRTPRPAARQLEIGFDAYDLDVAPDGEAFVAVTSPGQVRLWNARTLELEFDHRLPGRLFACALTADTAYAVGDRLYAIEWRSGAVRDVAVPVRLGRARTDPAGQWLLASHWNGGRLYLYRLPELVLVGELEAAGVATIAWDHDRAVFVTGSERDVCWIEPHAAGPRLSRRELPGGRALAAIPGLLAAGDAAIGVGTFADGAFTPLRTMKEVFAVAISPDGQRIAVGADNRRLRLLDRTGREVLVLDESPRPLMRLVFAAGGTRLVGLGRVSGAICYVMVWGADVR